MGAPSEPTHLLSEGTITVSGVSSGFGTAAEAANRLALAAQAVESPELVKFDDEDSGAPPAWTPEIPTWFDPTPDDEEEEDGGQPCLNRWANDEQGLDEFGL